MSIRIYNDSLAGTGASQTGRTDEISRAGSSGSRATQSSSSSGEDQVSISSLSEGVSAISSHRAARIEHLSQLYQSGRYQVDSTSISQAIVSHALSTGGTETP